MLRTTASKKRVFIWNSVGSAIYAISSFLLLIIVVRVCGVDEGGVFSIGYAIAQLMLTIGVFEATTYFATDAENRFTYAQYLGFKLITCTLMIVASVIYITSFGYDEHKTLVAYAICAYRLFEALSQYWFAAFQKENRLDISGFSTTWRSVISIAVFVLMLVLTEDIVLSMLLSSASEVVWICCYDVPRLRKIRKVGKPDFSLKPLMALFAACFPLFISSFLAIYLGNVCKYAIDAVGTDQMQTIFNVLFMPSFVINLFVNFFIRPSLTHMAELWLKREAHAFAKVIVKLLGAVVGITAFVAIGCAIIGIPVLELFYGIDLVGCLPALLVLMLGGGFLSASVVFYNAMVIIRAQNGVLVSYALAIAIAHLVATPFVVAAGVVGASVAYAISCAGLLLCFVLLFAWSARSRMKKW
ncbi:MAG: lipopolysaccharide biosynthesis protein [Raoultibacter sp.]